ncbi:MAG: tyrosine--tRNA ligase [Acidobacteria bacterium]|nr:MAG: tyrosine--tRNA ligase [Acidobacteriota bacterium]REK12142.1 MAG: tyrosine--tRNA ligase [Acidobacteriota bacterium]
MSEAGERVDAPDDSDDGSDGKAQGGAARFAPVDEQMELLARGSVDLVEEEQLRDKLRRSRERGVPLVVKTGFDPTAPDLHLGHSVLLRKMRHFQQLGHRVIFLIGDFTGMIGDPTGKKATRPQLTREEVQQNAETYQRQVFRILDRDRTEIAFNSTWLHELGSEGMVRLAGSYTLARMMEREDFRTRWESHQSISLHELLYPLAQGYDSVALEADIELGGHDQIFNLLVGRDLMRERGMEPQCVLTVPLLVGTDGSEKMSKSLGNSIGIEDSPREMYGRTMSIPDSLLWDWYLLLTDVPEPDIEVLRRGLEAGSEHPKALKQRLARTIVAGYHGEEAGLEAEREFDTIFARGGRPDEIDQARSAGPLDLLTALADHQLAPSRSQARRLIEQGAVSIDGEKQGDPFWRLEPREAAYQLKVGKRRFLALRVVAEAS